MGGRSKRECKEKRKQSARDQQEQVSKYIEETPDRFERNVKPLEAKTEAQGHYLLSIVKNIVTFGVGPAGTGKTYVCTTLAADMLASHKIEKIIITRPAIEAGESLGFLPGELHEKYAPYLAPVREILNERLGKSHVDLLIKRERIVALPLAYMRGHTFKDAFVILDEAQNTSPTQMKLFLTRAGDHSKLVVNGDPRQKDIRGASGLDDAIQRTQGIKGVSTVTFSNDDIVRSGIAQDMVRAYERD